MEEKNKLLHWKREKPTSIKNSIVHDFIKIRRNACDAVCITKDESDCCKEKWVKWTALRTSSHSYFSGWTYCAGRLSIRIDDVRWHTPTMKWMQKFALNSNLMKWRKNFNAAQSYEFFSSWKTRLGRTIASNVDEMRGHKAYMQTM